MASALRARVGGWERERGRERGRRKTALTQPASVKPNMARHLQISLSRSGGLGVFGAFGMAVFVVVRLLVKDLGVGTSKYVY